MSIPTPDASFKYSAFLSYSHRDERWARWLQRSIESYRVPAHLAGTTRRLAPVFRDRSDLPSATDLGAQIREALRDAASLVVICSPSARESRWVNEEIRFFRQLGRPGRIFCLIVEGEPNAGDLPGRESMECFAPALRDAEGGDGTGAGPRLEPIAADVRPGGDGRRNARLKIIAGLLGVGFDALNRRDQRRRNRRMAAVTAFALVLTAVMTALAIEARIARAAAEQRQKDAESLVGFMLTDLNDRLRQVQRLDILEAVDNRAMAYFTSLPVRDVTDQTLALRMKAMVKIGNVRQDQGQLAAARQTYEAAAGLGEELLRRRPDDPERQAGYAETLNHLGNAQWFQGDRDAALGHFTRAAQLLALATASRPSDPWLAVLASARTNAGRVHESRGEFEAARALYQSVLETARSMASREPGDGRRQAGVADAQDSLGKLALEQGELARAVESYRDVRRIRTALVAGSPEDRDAIESLLVSDAILGRTLALCGDGGTAIRHVRDAVDAARRLVAFDPKQVDWRLELARYASLLAELEREAGRLADAARHDAEALRTMEELAATDATNRHWQRELAGVRVESARLRLARGEPDAADCLLDAALATLDAEREARREDRSLRLLASQARTAKGQAALRRGRTDDARAQFIRARDAIAADAEVGANPNFLSARVTAQLLLGEAPAARPAIDRLRAMGYRRADFATLLASMREPYPVTDPAGRCGAPDGTGGIR
jgi:tetratricopeptide (TPR) repeat protein